MPAGPRSRRSEAFLSFVFQNPHDGHDGVPVSRRRGHAEQFVELAQVADRFHVPAVHSEDESLLRCDDAQEPFAVARKADGQRSLNAAGFGEDAHEANDVGACRLTCKRILQLQAQEIAAVAERHFRCERQLPEQVSAELCARSNLANDKRAGGTDVHNIVRAQFSGEDAGATRPMAADIDAAQENNESHAEIIRGRALTRMRIPSVSLSLLRTARQFEPRQ